MSDLVGLSAWGVVAGSIAGIVLHFNLPATRRQSVVQWCLLFGAASIVVFVASAMSGLSLVPTKGLLAMGFVGFPALVAGVLLVASGAVQAGASASQKEKSGV